MYIVIHSFIDGQFRLLLAIVNSAAMNTAVHVSFPVRVFFRYMPKVSLCFRRNHYNYVSPI